ncbi:hypothetical protein GGE67_006243 [Rhizobium leucaenae]|nr:hypothetical protein [Rhizobium leucaenae]
MRPFIEQRQRSHNGVGQKQNLTVQTVETSRKPNTAPGLGVASTPAIQVRSAVVDPCSTTAAFPSVFDSGLAATRRNLARELLDKASTGQATNDGRPKYDSFPSSPNGARQARPK